MKNSTFLLVGLILLLSCPTIYSQILINEFYADVAAGLVGDANGDGIRNAIEDEFIELVNPSDSLIDLIIANSGALGLGNSGAKVELKGPNGEIVEEFIYPDEDINASWTREPDITGGFKSHHLVRATYGLPYSPGTLLNSFPFGLNDNTFIHFPEISRTDFF